jgi:hypothetical protein
MAQVQPNEFTFIDFSLEEENAIIMSFTEAQLQFLQNFRSTAARNVISMEFDPSSDFLQKSIREQAYQRGRIDLVGDVFEAVSAARQAASQDDFPQPS